MRYLVNSSFEKKNANIIDTTGMRLYHYDHFFMSVTDIALKLKVSQILGVWATQYNSIYKLDSFV